MKDRQKQAENMRMGHYRRRYNSTISDYNFHCQLQNGKCGLCGKDHNYSRNHFDMDHDHFTGELRGLLCTKCNRLVGVFEHIPPIGLERKFGKMVEKYLDGRVLLRTL